MLSISTASVSFVAPTFAPAPRSATISMQEATPAPEPEPFNPVTFTKSLAGIAGPLDYFDPLGFCSGEVSEGMIRFFREAELKHGRVAMLASFGFLVAEGFHPLFGGSIDVPSYVAFQETPLQTFWPAVVTIIAIAEVFSV